MTDVTDKNFGYLIAYVIPGFVVVSALAEHSPTLAGWLGAVPESPTVGGFLYITVASVAAGMLLGALRWLVVDSIHHHTGISPPRWNFAELQEKQSAVVTVIEQHFRYYQFYAHTVLAILGVTIVSFWKFPWNVLKSPATILLLAMAMVVLFLASRDALRKYYDRLALVLSPVQRNPHREVDDPSGKTSPRKAKTNIVTGRCAMIGKK